MKKKNKSTKKSLVMSAISLVLCVAMLMGTTFAWFTDSVKSGVNKIQAGNLDIEVEYSNNGTSWNDLQDSESLFSNKLWEPGHTEYVYLRVKNAGTLALKYKVMVSPISENGGINVNNGNFKLSDYLVFGTTGTSTSFTAFADRAAARAAAGSTTGLNQAGLTKTSTIEAGTADQYLALVVYMPDTVGNEANAKPGTTAPSIDLGITVVATQLESEDDSFDEYYDKDAVNDPVYIAGAYYDYFEAVNETATAAGDGTFTVQKTDGSTGVIASASGTATSGSKVNMVVTKTSTPSGNFGISVDEGHELNGYDIKVTGQTENSLVQGKLYVGTGLENFKFYHDGTEMRVGTQGNLANNEYCYSKTDGFVYFATNTFSPFQATYKAPVAAIGTAVYGTVQDAINAAPQNATAPTVITILKDVKSGASFGFPDSTANNHRNVTINFAGHSYEFETPGMGSTGTENQAMHLIYGNTMTLKNGTVSVSKDSTAIKRMIQNYCDLTLENMTVDCSDVESNYNNSMCRGSLTVKGDTKLIASSDTAKIFDVDGAYCDQNGCDVAVNFDDSYVGTTSGVIEYVSSNNHSSTLTIAGGTFTGKITSSGASKPSITGGTFTSDPNEFCADGYCALQEGGVYHIVEGCLVSNKDELVAAANGTCSIIYLKNDFAVGSTVTLNRNVTLDGRDHTLTAYNANQVIDIRGAVDVTLKNTNIKFPTYTGKEGVRAIGTGNKLTFENVNISNAFKAIHFSDCKDTAVSIKDCNLTSVYPFNVNGGSVASFVVENSNLNGWTSFSNSPQCTYVFKNCSFGMGNGYATVKPYGNTTFENCTFSADYFSSLEGGIASGTTTPITINFNSCYMTTSDGVTQALNVDLLRTAFNYDITSGSNSGDSTINNQYWYVNGEQISFVPNA